MSVELVEVGLLEPEQPEVAGDRVLARSLTTDEEYAAAVAARLLDDRNEHVRSAKALLALLTVTTGRPDLDHDRSIAATMTACGLRTGPFQVEPNHVHHWVWRVSFVLWQAAGEHILDRAGDSRPERAVALARAALWPQGA